MEALERQCRTLAGQGKGAEAHVLAANKSGAPAEERVRLHALIAQEGDTCLHFAAGLHLKGDGCGSFGVVATRKVVEGERVLKETAVAPWSSKLFADDEALKHMLATTKLQQVRRTDGVFPRSMSEVPLGLACIREMSDRVRALSVGKSEEEIEGFILAAARGKLCGFCDGVYEFGSMFNSACAPNCEVRGEDARDLQVFAIKDIPPGEELCICYCNDSFIDYPAAMRREFLRSNWGFECACARCTQEEAAGGGVTEEAALNSGQGALCHDFTSSNLAGWQDAPWRSAVALAMVAQVYGERAQEAWLLTKASSGSSKGSQSQQAAKKGKGKGKSDKGGAKAGASSEEARQRVAEHCASFERVHALANLQHLMALRKAYLPEACGRMDSVRRTVVQIVDLYLAADRVCEGLSGFDTKEGLMEVKKRYLGMNRGQRG
eukprot:CAMPEP_0206242624 /NCGR_PEP_ID=MMETSP0047_2-20121206/17160_1 /ASSEMBLY_ACC=CAM_ASM_000192 /TAXON_ID=195065 /ORGANISM="Chroomonas mesostigmatica_cf, Strain CCMP1168" /LENGTH=434 /DNA_ID=CAMNT_0053667663 /DNA_START=24 /DNA_END=1329 /DNA_ORIENTATION=-